MRSPLFARKQAGGVFTIVGIDKMPGDVFFVNSATGADVAGNGQNPDAPFATLAYAVGLVTSGQGDVIFVMPGHVENIAAASGIACTKTNFSIIGLGNGIKRPTFSFTTIASATWAISGANVTVQNIRVTSTIAALVSMFVITAAGVTLDTVDYLEDGTHDVLQFALLNASATDCTIQNCSWIQSTTAATALAQWIVYNASHRLKVLNNYLWLKGYASSNPANGAIVGSTVASTAIRVAGNTFVVVNSTGNVVISCLAGDTGYIEDNYVGTSKTATAGSIVPQSCYCSQNFAANEVAKQGYLEPVADSN